MSSNHEHDHHGNDDHGHDHVPALATEIVPADSIEDHGLISLTAFCCAFLMFGISFWMQIYQPSGGGDHHSPTEHHFEH